MSIAHIADLATAAAPSRGITRRQFAVAAGLACTALGAGLGLGTARANADEQKAEPTDAPTEPAANKPGLDKPALYKPAPTAYPLTVSMVDGDGTVFEQVFEAAPTSAITLTDSMAEVMCRLGLADRVLGTVTPEATMPDEIAADYSTIEQLGDKKTLSREVVVGMGPEVVMGRAMTFTAEGQTDAVAYNDMGIKLFVQSATAAKGNPTLQGIIDDVKAVAEIFDAQSSASDLVNDLQDRLVAIKQRVAEVTADNPEPQSVLIMTNFVDGNFGLFGGATGATLQFNVIEMMGATMASTESASGLTYENLIQFDPDLILYVTADRNKETDPLVLDTLYGEETIQTVPAIANHKVILVPYATFMDATPRLFDTAETILEALYPQA